MLAIGAAGLMNAVGNLAPARVAALCNHAANGRWEEARKLHFDLFELNQAIFLETNPIPLKSMMARIGLLETSEVRLPLVPLDKERQSILDGVLRRAGLLESDRVEAVAGRTGHG
jgi:4-hydroxy-tetrahydrodipicolinate synthase